MTSNLGRALGGALIALTTFASAPAAFAQESTNQVAVMTDWSVFTEPKEGTPTECWGVAKPKESVNTRDGKEVTVKRSDILLYITYRPGQPGEVSFTGGYTFAEGSNVDVTIDGNAFKMVTQGEWAWAGSPADDAKLLAAMQKGSTAVLVARSGKGTQTKDTFSLSGFSAAVGEASKRCK